MSRATTTQNKHDTTPLRAKFLLHRTVIMITDVSDADLKRILEIAEKNEHPPHLLQ